MTDFQPDFQLREPVCPECGSNDVLFEAYAVYNPHRAAFELANTFDKPQFCQSCEEECSVVWRTCSAGDREGAE